MEIKFYALGSSPSIKEYPPERSTYPYRQVRICS